jgi:hypothetical protein
VKKPKTVSEVSDAHGVNKKRIQSFHSNTAENKLHTPDTLLPGKELPVPNGVEAGWAPDFMHAVVRRKTYSPTG